MPAKCHFIICHLLKMVTVLQLLKIALITLKSSLCNFLWHWKIQGFMTHIYQCVVVVFRVWSFCGSVWQGDASLTPTAASWLTRWDWGRHCSALRSCGLSSGRVLISDLRLIRPLWSPHPALSETGIMKWLSGSEDVCSLWQLMVAPRKR